MWIHVSAQLFTPGGGVTDISGNSYETIIINNREWMSENLRTSHFASGNPVMGFTGSGSGWIAIDYPSYCHYDDMYSYDTIFGKLYNWYAVNSGEGLCPSGWQVPSNEEWDELIDYLGGPTLAAALLKDTGETYWLSSDPGVTNESGFSARAGGNRGVGGSFASCLGSGYWWTSTDSLLDNGFLRAVSKSMNGNSYEVYNGLNLMYYGNSVRCIKEKDYTKMIILEKPSFGFYPNPAHEGITVLNPLPASTSYVLCDSYGRLLRSDQLSPGNNFIQLLELESGVYFIRIQESGEIYQFTKH